MHLVRAVTSLKVNITFTNVNLDVTKCRAKEIILIPRKWWPNLEIKGHICQKNDCPVSNSKIGENILKLHCTNVELDETVCRVGSFRSQRSTLLRIMEMEGRRGIDRIQV